MFYRVVKNLLGFLLKLFYKFTAEGKENIPQDGRLIICANHRSNWDPIFISIVFPRQVHWMAKKELFKNKILSWIIYKLESFPVDRHDTDITAIKNSLRVLKGEKVLGIFPEGTRIDSFDLNNAKAGTALLAIKSQSLVLPIYIDSTYKIFNKVKINIGKPIDLSQYYNQKLDNDDYLNITRNIMEEIYKLKN